MEKEAIASAYLVLFYVRSAIFDLFYEHILENVEKSLQSVGFREGQSGYSKHTYFFRLNQMWFF